MSRYGTKDTKDLPCTVGELMAHLAQFPADLPVIYRCFSDWAPLTVNEVVRVQGVPKACWVMRVYKEHIGTMSEENRANITEFVGFPGN